jgi:SNF2 family DNA or RNA helicase
MALTAYQDGIVKECMRKKRGCICVPMGSGKTLIGLTLIERDNSCNFPSIIVCSKTLVESWIHEIQKFFEKSMKYIVYHGDYMSKDDMLDFKPTDDMVVVTTPETVSRIGKELRIRQSFVTNKPRINQLVCHYDIPSKPILDKFLYSDVPGAFVFAQRWKMLLIDEIQNHTNIDTEICISLSSIFAMNRWGLSGTPVDNPKINIIMGVHYIVGDRTFPKCKIDAEKYVRSTAYPGMRNIMVIRRSVDFQIPNCNETIVTHSLNDDETRLYECLKRIVKQISTTRFDDVRGLNAHLLSMITYLRQFFVCPSTPFESIWNLDVDQNVIGDYFRDHIANLELAQGMFAVSSRMIEIEKILHHHQTERCILFNVFRKNVDKCLEFFKSIRPIFAITSKQSIQERAIVISDFEKTSNGLLMLTYKIGAAGLNLQRSHVVLLADVAWSDGNIQQAITRVLRRGQTEIVNVYLFTSNLSIEKSLFSKHIDKKNVIKSLMIGQMKGSVQIMSTNDILRDIIDDEEVYKLLCTSRNKVIMKL